MSKPRYRWWSFARAMIRDYPKLSRDMAEIHQQNISANISGMPRGGGSGRTVEQIALRQLPPDDQAAYDAVTKAKKLTALHKDGEEHLHLIELMYWKKETMTAKAASVVMNISYETAKRWHGAFVRLVGKCYGFNCK